MKPMKARTYIFLAKHFLKLTWLSTTYLRYAYLNDLELNSIWKLYRYIACVVQQCYIDKQIA